MKIVLKWMTTDKIRSNIFVSLLSSFSVCFLWLSKRRLNILNIQNCTQLVFYKGNNTLDKKVKYQTQGTINNGQPRDTVSLGCPLLIVLWVLPNVYVQCLWVVHCWLSCGFYLTYMYSVSGLSIVDWFNSLFISWWLHTARGY
jgi:hypothetical protein